MEKLFTIVLQAFLHEGPKILAIIVKEIEMNWDQIVVILAYMATSGGHFSRPLGMGGYWSYSG